MFECAICHRNENEVQIRMCTKAGMYLCSKHKNQFLRHGKFCDQKPIRTCEVCGKTSDECKVDWCSKANMYLCVKHRSQYVRTNMILPRTKRDANEYIMHDTYAEILFRTPNQESIIGKAIIDIDDVEKCKPYKWTMTEFMGNTRYVKAMINNQHVSLHRFVLNCSEYGFVDHINRNGLDNRKSNLRIVSISENCVNSKTRSKTGEKNIYFKNGKYQVQIIRDYKTVFIQTFDTIDEAITARDRFIMQYNAEHNRKV